MLRDRLATILILFAVSTCAGCASSDEKKEEPRGSTSSKAIGGACSMDPFGRGCAEQEERDARRSQERQEEEDYRREQEEERERNPGIEIDEEDEPCREGDEWCVG